MEEKIVEICNTMEVEGRVEAPRWRLKLKVKTTEEKRIGICFLVCNITRVKGHVGVPRRGLKKMTSDQSFT